MHFCSRKAVGFQNVFNSAYPASQIWGRQKDYVCIFLLLVTRSLLNWRVSCRGNWTPFGEKKLQCSHVQNFVKNSCHEILHWPKFMPALVIPAREENSKTLQEEFIWRTILTRVTEKEMLFQSKCLFFQRDNGANLLRISWDLHSYSEQFN